MQNGSRVGRRCGMGDYGMYHVVFEHQIARIGLLAAERALDTILALADRRRFDVKSTVDELINIYFQDKLGSSTASIVAGCRDRNIPVVSLNYDSLLQAGYKSSQQRIQATLTARTDYMCGFLLTVTKFRIQTGAAP